MKRIESMLTARETVARTYHQLLATSQISSFLQPLSRGVGSAGLCMLFASMNDFPERGGMLC